MPLNKQLYDGIVARERVKFGNFSFIKVDGNYSIPKFICCNGCHLTDVDRNTLLKKGFCKF